MDCSHKWLVLACDPILTGSRKRVPVIYVASGSYLSDVALVADEQGLYDPIKPSVMRGMICSPCSDHAHLHWAVEQLNVLVKLENPTFHLIDFTFDVNSPRWLMTARGDSRDREGRKRRVWGWGDTEIMLHSDCLTWSSSQ